MASSALLLPDFDRSPAPALDHALLHDAAILGLLQSARDHLGLEAAWIARYVEDDLREITHIASEIDLPLAAGSRQDRADSRTNQVEPQ